jgi:hypothetical protein
MRKKRNRMEAIEKKGRIAMNQQPNLTQAKRLILD